MDIEDWEPIQGWEEHPLDDALDVLEQQFVNDEISDERWVELAVGMNRMKRRVTELAEFASEKAIPTLNKSGPRLVLGSMVEAKSGSSRKKWDHEGLLTKASRRIRDRNIDFDTGEITGDYVDMMKDLFKLVGVSYWRVKECNKIGINVDDYCEVLPPKTSLVVSSSER